MLQIFSTKMSKLLNIHFIFLGVFFLCFSSVAVQPHKESLMVNNTRNLNSYSLLSISKVKYKNKVLTVAGDTDLPDKSILQIKIIPDNGAAKYSVFAKAMVENRKYNCEIGIPQKSELFKGPYKVVVSFILDMQENLNVLHLVGNGADNLTGDLVQREPITDYKILQCSVIKPLFTLQMEKYSLDSPGKFIKDSPKYVLVFFLTKWSKYDWKGMLQYSYAPWVKDTKNSEKLLESWFGSIKLVGVGYIEIKVSNDLMTEYKLELFYTKGKSKEVIGKSINIKLVKDNEGAWGVLPASIIEQHAIFDLDFKQ